MKSPRTELRLTSNPCAKGENCGKMSPPRNHEKNSTIKHPNSLQGRHPRSFQGRFPNDLHQASIPIPIRTHKLCLQGSLLSLLIHLKQSPVPPLTKHRQYLLLQSQPLTPQLTSEETHPERPELRTSNNCVQASLANLINTTQLLSWARPPIVYPRCFL